MNSTPLNTKTKEPCYRHGQIIEEKKEIQKSPTSKSGQKIDVKSPNRNVQPEKVVVPFRPRPNDHFVEETVEDLVDEDERFPLYKPENKPRAEPPAIDKEPVKAVVINQKPKETKTYVEPTPVVKEKRKLSQENIVIQDQRNHMTMVKSDKDLRASVVSEKTKPRQTTPNLEETEKALSASANGNFGMYGKFLGASTAVTEAELIAENKLLRHFLRDLNEILNQQMEKVKIEKIEEEHDWKKIEFKNKSSEEKMKTIVREIANNEKIMAINKEEYRKTEARKEGIKDANYVAHMQEEIDRIRMEIEDIKRDNKKLMHSNGNVGKDLDLIENVKGVPVSIEETREKQVEMKRIGKKLEALKQKNAISEEERKYKIEKQKTLTTEIMKLEREVEAQGPMEVGNRASRLDYLKLMAEEALIKAKKKCKGKKMLIEREIEQAALYNEREKDHIERLDAMLKDQSAALKGLSATTERPRMNNRSTQDLFDNHMRLSLEPEERNVWGSSNQIDDEKLEGLKVAPNRPLKTKSIERGGGRMINRDLFATHEVKKSNQSFSKYKHVIKRELVGDRRSMWREATDGDRARMEQILSPSPTGKHEPVTYTKPLGGLGHSSSVKRIGGKGIAEPTPFAYDMKQKARHFDSKDWHDNLEEGMSQGEETARKRQSKKEKGNQDEVTKLVKTLNPVKRKSQEDIMNESKNQQSSVDLKRNGQPDNSQSKSSVQPGKKTIDLKAKGGKPGKKMAQQDFDELEFDD